MPNVTARRLHTRRRLVPFGHSTRARSGRVAGPGWCAPATRCPSERAVFRRPRGASTEGGSVTLLRWIDSRPLAVQPPPPFRPAGASFCVGREEPLLCKTRPLRVYKNLLTTSDRSPTLPARPYRHPNRAPSPSHHNFPDRRRRSYRAFCRYSCTRRTVFWSAMRSICMFVLAALALT